MKDVVLLSVLSQEDRNSAKHRLHVGWPASHILSDVRDCSIAELRNLGGVEKLWAEYLTPIICGSTPMHSHR